MSTNNYFLKETYKQIEKIQELKKFTITIKDQFLSEEMYQTVINSFDEELKILKDKIKKYS